MYHLMGTELHCAPASCAVHHRPALCTMVHKGDHLISMLLFKIHWLKVQFLGKRTVHGRPLKVHERLGIFIYNWILFASTDISSLCLIRTCIVSLALELMTASGHLVEENWLQLLIPYQVTKSLCLVDSLSRHPINQNSVRDGEVITKLIVV